MNDKARGSFKNRFVGTVVILLLIIILLPMILENRSLKESRIIWESIPEMPQGIVTTRIISGDQAENPSPEASAAHQDVPSIDLIAPETNKTTPPPDDKVRQETQAQPEPTESNLPGTDDIWILQVASFRKRDLAGSLLARLRSKGYPASLRVRGSVYQVQIGPELVRERLDSIKISLRKDFGIKDAVIRKTELFQKPPTVSKSIPSHDAK